MQTSRAKYATWSVEKSSGMVESTERVKAYLLGLQESICKHLQNEDGGNFEEDAWQREAGGGGRTRILENGAVFERAGVNFSHIRGLSLPRSATITRPELEGCAFQVMGVSVVIHPQNPFVPTSHANIRFFSAGKPNDASPASKETWWFGGGYDLTPCYPFMEDVIHWHQTIKDTCDPFGDDVYPVFKRQCDEYFYLAHRNETRGVGGLFFDDLNDWGFDRCFDFAKAVGESYLHAYLPIINRRRGMEYSAREREFQLYRRGRYVEFNLVYDRGTLFGLQSGGRTESILMSLPPAVEWRYNYDPERGSAEAELNDYLKPRDWLTQ